MSKKIRIEYYGVEGEGATVREAKANAGQTLAAIVRDLGDGPAVVSWRGWSKLIWRDRHGWCSCFIMTPDLAQPEMSSCTAYDPGSREDAIVSATRHVADCGWTFEIADDAAYAAKVFAKLPRLRRAAAISEFLHRIGWQRRWQAAVNAGWSNEDARYVADGLQHLVPVERHPQAEVA